MRPQDFRPGRGRPLAAAWSRETVARVARALRAMLGAPDYDAYVAHHEASCAGAPPLTREQFVDARLRARYERPGSRCC